MTIETGNVDQTARRIEDMLARGIRSSWTRDDQFYLITIRAEVDMTTPAPMLVKVKVVALPNDNGRPVVVDCSSQDITLANLRRCGREIGRALQEGLDAQGNKAATLNECASPSQDTPPEPDQADNNEEVLHLRDANGFPLASITIRAGLLSRH